MTYLGGGPLSSDREKIATWRWQAEEQQNELIIWEVNANKMTRFPVYVQDVVTGPIAWSPDNQRLIYIQIENNCPVSGKSYLVLVDITTQEQTLLLESENPAFGGVEWNYVNVLSVLDANGNEWRYNLLTHKLIQIP